MAHLADASKVCTADVAETRVRAWRERDERIVFTNGCFDLLHAGHVAYLEQSRRLGDRLVIAVNSDRSVRAVKGPARPVVGQEDRARILAALAFVDAVIIFDEDTPLAIINRLRPDVITKGQDYAEDDVIGGAEAKSWGGRVALIPLLHGRSTTGILQRARADRSIESAGN
ncbi:MAG TPA: D-glycero-beta-D-manno-heptose 1-phosphate adenylyltransferase [Gemmatimonadales bacterium]